eukprot:2371200-Prymnesium_polylepis.2
MSLCDTPLRGSRPAPPLFQRGYRSPPRMTTSSCGYDYARCSSPEGHRVRWPSCLCHHARAKVSGDLAQDAHTRQPDTEHRAAQPRRQLSRLFRGKGEQVFDVGMHALRVVRHRQQREPVAIAPLARVEYAADCRYPQARQRCLAERASKRDPEFGSYKLVRPPELRLAFRSDRRSSEAAEKPLRPEAAVVDAQKEHDATPEQRHEQRCWVVVVKDKVVGVEGSVPHDIAEHPEGDELVHRRIVRPLKPRRASVDEWRRGIEEEPRQHDVCGRPHKLRRAYEDRDDGNHGAIHHRPAPSAGRCTNLATELSAILDNIVSTRFVANSVRFS